MAYTWHNHRNPQTDPIPPGITVDGIPWIGDQQTADIPQYSQLAATHITETLQHHRNLLDQKVQEVGDIADYHQHIDRAATQQLLFTWIGI